MIRNSALTPLIDSLREMVTILSLDRECPWLQPFSMLLEQAESLKNRGCTEYDLIELASAIRGKYSEGSGFTSYAPLEFNPCTCGYWYIFGAENFCEVSSRLSSLASGIMSRLPGEEKNSYLLKSVY